MPTQHWVRARIATGSVVAGCVVALALVDGGYFPTTWGLLLLVCVLAAGIAAIVSETFEVGWRDIAFVTGLATFALWQLASIFWSDGVDAPVLEAERTLMYVTAIAALLLVVRTTNVDSVMAGLGLGTVLAALLGVVAHLALSAPSVTAGRLAQPIGYANADGLLAGFGLIFALAAASRGRVLVRAGGAAASVPLATGLYLSLSRGAILATALGIVCMLAVDRRRIETLAIALVLAVPVTAALVIASHSPVMAGGSSPENPSAAGRRLLVELVLLALCAAAGTVAATRVGQWFVPSRRGRRRLETGVGLAGAVALVLAIAAVGGPVQVAHDAVDSFAAGPSGRGDGSSARLASGSGSFRAQYWQVAWRAAEQEPVHGTGAGSFERWWLSERSIDENVRDAHNLYLEVLAEVGLVGLVILCTTLVVPLTAVAGARARPFMPAATGMYVAYLAHASLDWDWEIPSLTMVALACGVGLIVAVRSGPGHPFSFRRRVVVLGLLVPLLALAVAIHGGQGRLEKARRSLERGNSVRAAGEAAAAERWLPWAAEPWQVRGEALLAEGDLRGAAAALQHASRMNPSNWEVWYDLALVEQGAARAEALERAKALNPRSTEFASLGAP